MLMSYPHSREISYNTIAICFDLIIYYVYYIIIHMTVFAEAQPRTNAAFGQGVGDIFLDNVVCDGNELRLVDCASNPFATHNCQHTQDAGVVCQAALSRKSHRI